jgi:hypothetical protein
VGRVEGWKKKTMRPKMMVRTFDGLKLGMGATAEMGRSEAARMREPRNKQRLAFPLPLLLLLLFLAQGRHWRPSTQPSAPTFPKMNYRRSLSLMQRLHFEV